MFSGEKSEREKSTERLKYGSGAQLLIGVGLIVCASMAVSKLGDNYLNYFIGGFTCGITGFVAGCLGVYTFHKASSYRGDDPKDLQRQLGCMVCSQMVLGTIVFFTAFSGVMMNVIFLAVSYDREDETQRIHMILSVCILVGIVILLSATFLTFRSMGTCCTAGYNHHNMQRTYPNTGTTTLSTYPNSTCQTAGYQPVFSTGGLNAQSNASYPVSQFHTGGNPAPQPPQPPPYGFQPSVFSTQQPSGPPPAYPY